MQRRKKTKKRKVQRQVKDRLFRFLFEKDKEANTFSDLSCGRIPEVSGAGGRKHIWCEANFPANTAMYCVL